MLAGEKRKRAIVPPPLHGFVGVEWQSRPSPCSHDTGWPCVFTEDAFDSCGKMNWLDDAIFSMDRQTGAKDWWKRGKESQWERQEWTLLANIILNRVNMATGVICHNLV